MNHIIYVAHGAACYRQEAVYSILSALRRQPESAWVSQGGGQGVLVVTDEADAFRRYLGDTPLVRYVKATREQFDSWRGGPDGYVHRIKPLAILHAAEVMGIAAEDNILFVDSDTSFQVPPSLLFSRIAGGDVLMNELEGRLCDLRSNTRSHRRLHDAVRDRAGELAGELGPVPLDLPLWNSGIIGIRGAQLEWLRQAVPMIDRMWPVLRIAATEQVALSTVLNAYGVRPRETLVEVLHYHVFKEFRDDLALFFGRHDGASLREWVTLAAQVDPYVRIQPKLAFNRLPKWQRQVRKAFGQRWKPVPYPWTETAP